VSKQSAKIKKAATATAGEQSAKTNATEPAQSQPTTAPDVAVPGTAPAAVGAEATSTQKQRNISAATKTSVSLKQKSQPQTTTVPRFAGLNEGQLHRQMVAARDELFNRCVGVESYTKDELLPLCEEVISRYKQQGRKYRLNSMPTVEAYFKGIDLNYNTVRVWIHRRKLQTAMFQLTDGKKKDDGTKPEKLHLNKAETDTLIETGHLLGEIVMENNAGRPIEPLLAKADKLIDAKRLDDILETARTLPDYRRHLERLLSVIESFNGTLPAKVTDAAKDIRKDITPKQAAAALYKASKRVPKARGIIDILPPRQSMAPLPKTAPPIKVKQAANPEKPTLAAPVTVVTAKPGFTCKFNGNNYEVTAVSADGMSANLRVAATGAELRMVPVAELRYVVDPDVVEAV
jgi:hypothetical protein